VIRNVVKSDATTEMLKMGGSQASITLTKPSSITTTMKHSMINVAQRQQQQAGSKNVKLKPL
jgi:beta-lactamase class D